MITRSKLLISGMVLASAMTLSSKAAAQQTTPEIVSLSETQKWEALEQYFNAELKMQLGQSDALGQTLRNHRWLQVVAMVGSAVVAFGLADKLNNSELVDNKNLLAAGIFAAPAIVGLLYNRRADKSKPSPKKCLDALIAFIQEWPKQRSSTPEALCGYFDVLRKRWDVAPNLAFGSAESAQLIIDNIANFINANKLC